MTEKRRRRMREGGRENVKVDKKCPCMIAIENTAR